MNRDNLMLEERLLEDGIVAALREGTENDSAIVTGWVLMVEYVGSDGKRYLGRRYPESVSYWGAMGMLHEGLNGVWDHRDDDAREE